MKLMFLIVLLFIPFIGFAYEYVPYHIQPLNATGDIMPNSPFNFHFNFSKVSTCDDIVAHYNGTIITNKYGKGFVGMNLTFTGNPKWLCIYNMSTGTLISLTPSSAVIVNRTMVDFLYADGNVTAADHLNGKLDWTWLENVPVFLKDNATTSQWLYNMTTPAINQLMNYFNQESNTANITEIKSNITLNYYSWTRRDNDTIMSNWFNITEIKDNITANYYNWIRRDNDSITSNADNITQIKQNITLNYDEWMKNLWNGTSESNLDMNLNDIIEIDEATGNRFNGAFYGYVGNESEFLKNIFNGTADKDLNMNGFKIENGNYYGSFFGAIGNDTDYRFQNHNFNNTADADIIGHSYIAHLRGINITEGNSTWFNSTNFATNNLYGRTNSYIKMYANFSTQDASEPIYFLENGVAGAYCYLKPDNAGGTSEMKCTGNFKIGNKLNVNNNIQFLEAGGVGIISNDTITLQIVGDSIANFKITGMNLFGKNLTNVLNQWVTNWSSLNIVNANTIFTNNINSPNATFYNISTETLWNYNWLYGNNGGFNNANITNASIFNLTVYNTAWFKGWVHETNTGIINLNATNLSFYNTTTWNLWVNNYATIKGASIINLNATNGTFTNATIGVLRVGQNISSPRADITNIFSTNISSQNTHASDNVFISERNDTTNGNTGSIYFEAYRTSLPNNKGNNVIRVTCPNPSGSNDACFWSLTGNCLVGHGTSTGTGTGASQSVQIIASSAEEATASTTYANAKIMYNNTAMSTTATTRQIKNVSIASVVINDYVVDVNFTVGLSGSAISVGSVFCSGNLVYAAPFAPPVIASGSE